MRKIVICLILILNFAAVAFTQSGGSQEYKYVVTITYSGGDGNILTEKITVLSTSSTEAENKAARQWEAVKRADWEFKFANAERIDEPVTPQVAAPQTFGYLKITNAHPWPTNINQTKMWVQQVFIKPSTASEYDDKDYIGGSRLGTDKSTSISLGTGVYDIKVVVFRNWFDQRFGDAMDTISVESRNVQIRENMVTEVSMRGGSLSVSQPRKE